MSGSHSSIIDWNEASASSSEAVGSLLLSSAVAVASGDDGAVFGADTDTESLSLAVATLSPSGASAAFSMGDAAAAAAATGSSSRDNLFLAAIVDMGIVANSRRVASTVKWVTTQLGDDVRRRVAITDAFDFCNEMEIDSLLI